MTRLRLLAVVVVLAILTISTGVVVAAPPQQTPPGVTFSPSPFSVPELTGTGTYTVVLDTAPAGDVTITLTSSEATVSPGTLMFATSGAKIWSMPQTVTVNVTPVDDFIDHVPNRIAATISHTISGYTGVTSAELTVTFADDDRIGVEISPSSPDTLEGQTVSITVKLTSQPTGPVMLTMTSITVDSDLVITPGTLTVAPADWSTGATFMVRALWDIDPTPRTEQLSVTATGGGYDGYRSSAINSMIREDTTTKAVITTRDITIVEGGTETYQVVLNAAPTADVIVTPASSDTNLSFTPPSLTFTTAELQYRQSFTVTAANDGIRADGMSTITHTSMSTDTGTQAPIMTR